MMRDRPHILVLLAALLLLPACSDNREHASRAAVKALLDSKDSLVRHHRARLVAMGRYVLPDIEQEYQGAPYKGRLRLLDVLERMGDPEAVHLVRHIARWDEEDLCRERAKKVLLTLQKKRN